MRSTAQWVWYRSKSCGMSASSSSSRFASGRPTLPVFDDSDEEDEADQFQVVYAEGPSADAGDRPVVAAIGSVGLSAAAPLLPDDEEEDGEYCFMCESDYGLKNTAHTRTLRRLLGEYAYMGRKHFARTVRDFYEEKILTQDIGENLRPWKAATILQHVEVHDPNAAVVAKQDFRSQDRLRIALESNGLLERDETTGLQRPNVKQGNFYLKVLASRTKALERLLESRDGSGSAEQ